MEIIQYPNYILKFIIIGSSQVGKTSLIRRFTDNIYEDTLRTTIGVDFKFKCINMLDNKTARIQIWDTAGQERFKSITNKYYNDVHGTIICFDISNYDSFACVKDWLYEINKYCRLDTKKILVGTKSDLVRAVSKEVIHEFCAENELSYIETSSKNNENCENPFIELANDVITSKYSLNIDKHINLNEVKNKERFCYKCCD